MTCTDNCDMTAGIVLQLRCERSSGCRVLPWEPPPSWGTYHQSVPHEAQAIGANLYFSLRVSNNMISLPSYNKSHIQSLQNFGNHCSRLKRNINLPLEEQPGTTTGFESLDRGQTEGACHHFQPWSPAESNLMIWILHDIAVDVKAVKFAILYKCMSKTISTHTQTLHRVRKWRSHNLNRTLCKNPDFMWKN